MTLTLIISGCCSCGSCFSCPSGNRIFCEQLNVSMGVVSRRVREDRSYIFGRTGGKKRKKKPCIRWQLISQSFMVFVYCSRLTDIKLLTQNKRCSRCTPQLFQGAISQCGLLGNRFLSLTLTPLHVPPNSLHHRLCNVDFQQPQSGRVICVHRLDVFKQMFSRSYINVGPQTCPITAHSPPTGMASSPL